jgi:type II secretory pathway pseudopilin PulG
VIARIARHTSQAGYSLVEMLVTIIMFTLIVGSITTVVITTMKHQTSLSDRGTALASLRNSLEQVDRDIRSANPLCYATGSEVAMYEQSGGNEGIVDYSVQPDKHNPSVMDLEYRHYVAVQSPASGTIVCALSTTPPGVAVATVTDYYEIQPPTATRTVIYGLTGSTSTIFTALQTGSPSLATFSNCITNGVSPTGLTASTIAVLTATASVQPASLHTPVTATDCGTFIRNEDLPQ